MPRSHKANSLPFPWVIRGFALLQAFAIREKLLCWPQGIPCLAAQKYHTAYPRGCALPFRAFLLLCETSTRRKTCCACFRTPCPYDPFPFLSAYPPNLPWETFPLYLPHSLPPFPQILVLPQAALLDPQFGGARRYLNRQFRLLLALVQPESLFLFYFSFAVLLPAPVPTFQLYYLVRSQRLLDWLRLPRLLQILRP